MALNIADRVQETTSTQGTGTVLLSGAVTGYQSFAAIGNSNTTYYTIADQAGANWEVGIGTYYSANTSLARTTILVSSNANAAVNFGVGVKNVFVTYPAEKAIYSDANNVTTITDLVSANAVITGGTINNTSFNNVSVVSANITTANVSSQLNLTNASNYNLYASGAGANYMAGSLGIGSTTLTARNLGVSKTITGGTTAYNIVNNGAVQSDVTTNAFYNWTNINTAAAAFTLTTAAAYYANQGTIGAGSAITSQYGFLAQSTLTGATNNYAFYGGIPAATGAYNLYMAGTANNYLAGSLGIGGVPQTAINLRLVKTITGATTAYGFLNQEQIQSDVTSVAYLNYTGLSTAAASFTLATGVHYIANQETIGAGSAITSQYGFFAQSTLTGATNNYGFYGNIAAATGAYNLYMNGTANNYLAGSLGIGSTSLTGFNLRVSKSLTGATTGFAIRYDGTIQSDVTGTSYLYSSQLNTQATAFTATAVQHYTALQGTIGSTSAVTAQYGFVADSGLTGATSNYGFFGNIASGANRYNIYMNGTAANWFSGDVLIFGAGGLGYTTGSGGAVTQATSRTTGVTLDKTNGAITLVSAAGSAIYQSFTVTNNKVAATDTIIVNQKSGTDKYIVLVTNVAAGSFQVTFATTGGITTEQPVFNFAVIKAVTA